MPLEVDIEIRGLRIPAFGNLECGPLGARLEHAAAVQPEELTQLFRRHVINDELRLWRHNMLAKILGNFLGFLAKPLELAIGPVGAFVLRFGGLLRSRLDVPQGFVVDCAPRR